MRMRLLLCFVLYVCIAPVTAQDSPDVHWNDTVWYEIFVRSFYDSDGDGVGDIQGVIEKLDYINDGDPTTTDDLGANGIWLMPVNPSPTYHGYDVTDYYGINPDYGTLEDFRQLIDEAHARGIKVIIDLVINHSSSQHPYFIESATPGTEYENWYIWRDEHPGFTGPEGQTVWHPRNDRYYYGIFESGMPDLNHRNPEVTNEIFNIVDFWVGDVGVDGFRIDAVKYLIEEDGQLADTVANREWMAIFTEYVKRVNADALVLGEIWSPTLAVTRYVEDNAVDMAFEFDLAEAIFSSVRGANARNVSRAFDRGLRGYPHGRYATFLTNHDQDRYASRVDGDMGRLRSAAAILLLTPGSPFIYYGEEIGMFGSKPDPRIRTPMQWTDAPVTAGFTTTNEPYEPLAEQPEELAGTINVAAQADDPDSLLSLYRDLIHLRQDHAVLQHGQIAVMDDATRGIFAFLRHDDDDVVLVLINLDDEPVSEITLGLDEGPLSTHPTAAQTLYGEAGEISLPEVNEDGGFADYAPVPIMEPFSTLVIQLE